MILKLKVLFQAAKYVANIQKVGNQCWNVHVYKGGLEEVYVCVCVCMYWYIYENVCVYVCSLVWVSDEKWVELLAL